MTEIKNHIEVRTFYTIDEIESLANFRPNNPVDNESYQDIVGDYDFGDTVKCCFKKPNGNLCAREHKYGFVALLKDETVTIVGNCCAKDKFGADAKIKRDRSKYLKEKARRQKLNSLRDEFSQKDEKLRRLDMIIDKINALSASVSYINENVGEFNAKRLSQMARSNVSDIVIKIVKERKGDDGEGHIVVENEESKHTIGNLKGLSIFLPGHLKYISHLARMAKMSYEDLSEVNEDMDIKSIERVQDKLNRFKQAEKEYEKAVKDYQIFIANDYLLLCFLSPAKSDQYKAARFAMEQKGMSTSKDKAKLWFVDIKNKIKKELKADKLKIAA